MRHDFTRRGADIANTQLSPLTNRMRRFPGTLVRFIALTAFVCVLVVIGLALWNVSVVRWEQAHIVVPGSFYRIEGRQMHLYCVGSGSPTIVIEAGIGADWLGWQIVQPRLANLTRVCTYDRAGLGWSEPQARPRDAEAVVRQLHALLDEAKVRRPMVLVGHSGGGFFVREYAREFPAEVAGVVLVDSTSPQQIDELPGFRAGYEADKRSMSRDLWIDRLRVSSGLERLLGNCHDTPGKGLGGFANLFNAKTCRPEYVDTDFGEYRDFETSAHEAARLTTLGNKPLLVLSRDPATINPGMTSNGIAGLKIWDKEQELLKSLSPESWRLIARGSGHKIYQDRPDVVCQEITRMIEFLRGGPQPPFGTTRTE
jgi:pimeloyl-ACP methyl ester carboxylesterase